MIYKILFKNWLRLPDFMKSAFISLSIFLLITSFFNFTFSTDDYRYLSHLTSETGLRYEDFGYYWSRVPIWAFLTYWFFRFDHAWLFIYPIFLLYTSSYCYFIDYLIRETKLKVLEENRLFLILLSVCFCFFPNYFEVLYWPTTMTYVFGAFFMACGLHSRVDIIRYSFFVLSFLTSEMYLLPSLSFVLFPVFFNQPTVSGVEKNTPLIIKNITYWILSIAVFFMVRFAISIYMGSYQHGISFDLNHMIGQVGNIFKYFFFMEFYKVYWGQTIVYFFTILYLIYFSFKEKNLCLNESLIVVFFCFFSSCIYIFLAYNASRALFGAGMFVNGIIVWFIFNLTRNHIKIARIALSLILLSFMTQNFLIYSIKDYNYDILRLKENELVAKIGSCRENDCEIPLKSLDEGLKNDWVLHRDYWVYYAEWIKNKSGIKKEVHFFVED